MAESQSRYGIMEELNNRKINEKEKLANIERETDAHIYSNEEGIRQTEEQIKHKKQTYEGDHRSNIRELNVNLDMVNAEYERNKGNLEAAIKEEDATYKPNFEVWEKAMLAKLEKDKEGLKRYKMTQEKKITEKKDVITEIENGVTSLKEMSKEHSTQK